MSTLARFSFYLAAAGSMAASLAHVWAIVAGPAAYASLGAPPDIIASAEAGTWYAPTITAFIAAVIMVWALYALSATGRLPRLLLLRTALNAIAIVLILRGLIIIPALFIVPEQLGAFAYWSSAICLMLGALFATGLILGWQHLAPRS